ncbi:secondary thiamine-phosphate synthase enzyme YjbQ [Desulfomarina sp.]
MLNGTFTLSTPETMKLIDISSTVENIITDVSVSSGLCYLFNPHTTAGLTINEGADPAVRSDIIKGFLNIVPAGLDYSHLEGNSVAHIMASLMGNSLVINIINGRPMLGTWQKIFFCEFDGPRTRKIHWKIIPDRD